MDTLHSHPLSQAVHSRVRIAPTDVYDDDVDNDYLSIGVMIINGRSALDDLVSSGFML